MANKLYLWRRRMIMRLTDYLKIPIAGNLTFTMPSLEGKYKIAEILKICRGELYAELNMDGRPVLVKVIPMWGELVNSIAMRGSAWVDDISALHGTLNMTLLWTGIPNINTNVKHLEGDIQWNISTYGEIEADITTLIRTGFANFGIDTFGEINLDKVLPMWGELQLNVATSGNINRTVAEAYTGELNMLIEALGKPNLNDRLEIRSGSILTATTGSGVLLLDDIVPIFGQLNTSTLMWGEIDISHISSLIAQLPITMKMEGKYNVVGVVTILIPSIGNLIVGKCPIDGRIAEPDVKDVATATALLEENLRSVIAYPEMNTYTRVANAAGGWSYYIDAIDYSWNENAVRIGGKPNES